MTVRGLEPELERIVAQRGRERQQLQACHQGVLGFATNAICHPPNQSSLLKQL